MTAARRRPRIVVVGSSNTDLVVRSDRLPAAGETVLGGDFLIAAGGKGANQAVAAARLGADVALVTRLGDDTFGDDALSAFRAEGIETRHIVRDPELASGVALIIVGPDGENQIAVAPGANGNLSPRDIDAAQSAIDAADLVLLQLEVPIDTVRHAARLARTAGARVILDPAPAMPLDAGLLADVSLLTPNRQEASTLTGVEVMDEPTALDAANRLLAAGPNDVLITLGAQGTLHVGADGARQRPAPQVEALDTTAAGDTFNGALACGLGEGLSLDEAIVFASRAAAIAVGRRGAQPAMPRRDELA